jgi:hypothetical protein
MRRAVRDLPLPGVELRHRGLPPPYPFVVLAAVLVVCALIASHAGVLVAALLGGIFGSTWRDLTQPRSRLLFVGADCTRSAGGIDHVRWPDVRMVEVSARRGRQRQVWVTFDDASGAKPRTRTLLCGPAEAARLLIAAREVAGRQASERAPAVPVWPGVRAALPPVCLAAFAVFAASVSGGRHLGISALLAFVFTCAALIDSAATTVWSRPLARLSASISSGTGVVVLSRTERAKEVV